MSIPSINKAVIVGRVDEQPKVGTYGEGKKKMMNPYKIWMNL